MIPYTELNAGKVLLSSTWAFLLVAREYYLAFKNHNDDDRSIHVEMNRLVPIVICCLPSFAAYIDTSLPHLRLVQSLFFNGIRYDIQREHWVFWALSILPIEITLIPVVKSTAANALSRLACPAIAVNDDRKPDYSLMTLVCLATLNIITMDVFGIAGEPCPSRNPRFSTHASPPNGHMVSDALDWVLGLPNIFREGQLFNAFHLDCAKRLVHLNPTTKDEFAEMTADFLLRNIIRLHGLQRSIATDR